MSPCQESTRGSRWPAYLSGSARAPESPPSIGARPRPSPRAAFPSRRSWVRDPSSASLRTPLRAVSRPLRHLLAGGAELRLETLRDVAGTPGTLRETLREGCPPPGGCPREAAPQVDLGSLRLPRPSQIRNSRVHPSTGSTWTARPSTASWPLRGRARLSTPRGKAREAHPSPLRRDGRGRGVRDTRPTRRGLRPPWPPGKAFGRRWGAATEISTENEPDRCPPPAGRPTDSGSPVRPPRPARGETPGPRPLPTGSAPLPPGPTPPAGPRRWPSTTTAWFELAALPTDVVNAADRRPVTERAVGPAPIVGLHPAGGGPRPGRR